MNPQEIQISIDEALVAVTACDTADSLEAARIKYLGKKGLLPEIMKSLGSCDKSQKAEIGKLANQFKVKVSQAVKDQSGSLKSSS